jgi:hypothetical protein
MTRKKQIAHISDLLPVLSSMAQATACCGISASEMKLAKAAGCPAFEPANRIRLSVLLKWHFANSSKQDDEQPPDGLATWRDALNRAQTKREEIRLAKDKGQVVEFDEARRQASEAAALYFAELDRMCRELPPIVKGLDEIGVFKKLEQRREEIRETLNRAFDAVGKQE